MYQEESLAEPSFFPVSPALDELLSGLPLGGRIRR